MSNVARALRNIICLCFHLIYDLGSLSNAANISKGRSVIDIKNFDALRYRERKENGFPRSSVLEQI